MCWNYPQTPPGAIPSFVIPKCWHEKQESAQWTPCRHLHGAQTFTIGERILVLNQAFAESSAGSRAGHNSNSPPKVFQFFQRFQVGSRVFDSPWDVEQFIKYVPLPFEEDTGEDKHVPLPHKKFPALCLESWQEPGGDPSGQAAKCPTRAVSAVAHWQQRYICTAVWMHKAFFELLIGCDK